MPSDPVGATSFPGKQSLPAGSAFCHDPAPVGAVAVGFLLGTYGLFRLPVDLSLLVAGFCGVSLAYATDRIWTSAPEDRVNHPERVVWVQSHIRWLAAETVLFIAVGGAMLFCLEWSTLLCVGGLGAVASLHILFRGRGSLRNWGEGKPVAIAGAWALGGGVLPLVEAEANIGLGAVLFSLYRFLFVLPNLMLADWRDQAGDAAAGLAPWAARWTKRQVQWIATGGLLLAVVGAIGWALVGSSPFLVGIDAVGPILMIGVVWQSRPARPTHALLADLVVGWPIVPFFLRWMMV